MKKFLIFAPRYNENVGGVICLHYLAHLINKSGAEAYVAPIFNGFEFNKLKFKRPFFKVAYAAVVDRFRRFRTNPDFNLKVLEDIEVINGSDEWIVIYPEITFGNPLAAKNVVRWLLHNPGFHTGTFYYGVGELHVKYHHGFLDFNYPGSVLSKNILNISYFPLHLYNDKDASINRKGTAYCLRKGRGREIQHDLTDSVLIDDMSHAEVASVFKRVKVFVSYDLYTAYSVFAALCGCDSVVIPQEGLSKEEWQPNPESRYGQAYGFNDVLHASNTRHLLVEKVYRDHERNQEIVEDFIKEANDFFSKR